MEHTPDEYQNKWKEYHEFLVKTRPKEFQKYQDEICLVIRCSRPSFFRKLKSPQDLSIAEKIAIAGVYQIPANWIFPELQTNGTVIKAKREVIHRLKKVTAKI